MKNVAVFASTWSQVLVDQFVRGMKERIGASDVNIHIFNLYDESIRTSYYDYEMKIFHLPHLEDYDGLILLMNSVDSIDPIRKIAEDYIKMNRPVISVDHPVDGAGFIGTDNYHAMYQMVEHMVVHHGCRLLNYVGGPLDNEEDQLRCKAFRDCLKKYGLMVEEERICHYRFLDMDGAAAYQKYKQNGLHIPDVVICANDLMAEGYIQAARNDGYTAGSDFFITGFDNTERGQQFYPAITSVDRDYFKQGFLAMDYVMESIAGKTVNDSYHLEGFVQENESCGCSQKRILEKEYIQLIQSSRKTQQFRYGSNAVRNVICCSYSVQELQSALRFVSERLHTKPLAVALSSVYLDETIQFTQDIDYFSDNMFIITAGKITTQVRRERLFPEEWEQQNGVILLYNALHLGSRLFGYTVMPFDEEMYMNQIHREVNESLSLGLENMMNQQSIIQMNRSLSELYVRDALTGLYNRFGYGKYAEVFLESRDRNIYVVYMDVDNLKTANDRYGHAVGDELIALAANILKKVFFDSDLMVRMGGDEFLIMGEIHQDLNLDERIREIHDALRNEGNRKGYPFPVTASLGYVLASHYPKSISLDSLVAEADQKMYQNKRRKYSK